MTGDEFVATWNDLFRLRDTHPGTDTCLDRPEFIETVSENIKENATRLLQHPGSHVVTHTNPQPIMYQPPNHVIHTP